MVGFTKCLAEPANKIYETDFVHLFIFRNNKIVKFQEYFDTFITAEAFKNKSQCCS
jgi:ketosteroid isomerase-like protein